MNWFSFDVILIPWFVNFPDTNPFYTFLAIISSFSNFISIFPPQIFKIKKSHAFIKEPTYDLITKCKIKAKWTKTAQSWAVFDSEPSRQWRSNFLYYSFFPKKLQYCCKTTWNIIKTSSITLWLMRFIFILPPFFQDFFF